MRVPQADCPSKFLKKPFRYQLRAPQGTGAKALPDKEKADADPLVLQAAPIW
jgi:hypothetical protein